MAKFSSGLLAGLALGIIFSIVIANASNHQPGTGPGPGATPVFKVSGKRYLPKGTNFRVGYVAGSLDAFIVSVHIAGTGKPVFDFKNCIDNWTEHEMIAYVDRYLHDNQNQRQHSAAFVTYKVLKEACLAQTSPAATPGSQ